MSIQATRKLNFLEINSLERSINKRLPQFIWIYMHIWAWIKIHSIGVMLIDTIFYISKSTDFPFDRTRDRRTVRRHFSDVICPTSFVKKKMGITLVSLTDLNFDLNFF